MIEVDHKPDGITIEGHAYYAPRGQDIVCAGVSALALGLIDSLEELTEDTIEYDISIGLVDIRYRDLSAKGQLLVDSFFVGIKLIADQYPDYVRIVQACTT